MLHSWGSLKKQKAEGDNNLTSTDRTVYYKELGEDTAGKVCLLKEKGVLGLCIGGLLNRKLNATSGATRKPAVSPSRSCLPREDHFIFRYSCPGYQDVGDWVWQCQWERRCWVFNTGPSSGLDPLFKVYSNKLYVGKHINKVMGIA